VANDSRSVWLACGAIWRGWGCAVSGNIAEGISWIEDGIEDFRATGSILGVPSHLVVKAETLHLAGRTSEALETLKEAEALAQRTEERECFAELQRLRGVFLVAIGADETQIEASFSEAIRIAKDQKSVSLEKRAEASYEEYRDQKGDR
jgi:predicted ATPase